MLPYDPRRNYFGAEGSKLSDVLEEILKLMPALRDGWNYAAYNHDKAYIGTKKKGVFAAMVNFFSRRKTDKIFRADLEEAVAIAEDVDDISTDRADRAMVLAEISYRAVRLVGWQSYKTGGQR